MGVTVGFMGVRVGVIVGVRVGVGRSHSFGRLMGVRVGVAFLRFCKSERDKGRPSGHVYGCQSKDVLGEKFLGASCEELRLNL